MACSVSRPGASAGHGPRIAVKGRFSRHRITRDARAHCESTRRCVFSQDLLDLLKVEQPLAVGERMDRHDADQRHRFGHEVSSYFFSGRRTMVQARTSGSVPSMRGFTHVTQPTPGGVIVISEIDRLSLSLSQESCFGTIERVLGADRSQHHTRRRSSASCSDMSFVSFLIRLNYEPIKVTSR